MRLRLNGRRKQVRGNPNRFGPWLNRVSIDVSDLLRFEHVRDSSNRASSCWFSRRRYDGFHGYPDFQNQKQTGGSHGEPNEGHRHREAYTTAINAGFILGWLTIGTTLVLNAQIFGFLGFAIFTGVHWFVDFVWYTVAAFAVFSSQRFWNYKVRGGITLFCSLSSLASACTS